MTKRTLTGSLLTGFTGLALVAGALVACGGDEEGALTEDQFCTQKGAAECAGIKVACSYATTTACETARKAACIQWAAGLKAVTTTGRMYRPANAKACISATTNTYKGTIDIASLRALETTCSRVYEGTIKDLTVACAADLDCVSPATCDAAKLRCSTPRAVAAGAACSNPGEFCPTGQYCAMTGAFFMCTAKAASGADCTATPCLETLRCVAGKCAERLAAGMTCAVDSDCTTGYCEPYNKKCALNLGFSTGSPSCEVFEGKTPTVNNPGVDAAIMSTADAGSGG